MSSGPILYSFRRCPYAMRARMALQVSGIPHEIREIVLRDKPEAMLAASPKGTVPVLVLPDSEVVDQSIDIMRWALAQSDPEGWLDGEDPDTGRALIERNDGDEPGGFKHHLDRYKYATRYDVDPLEHRTIALAILIDMDARLADRAFLNGAKRMLADIATFPFVRQFAHTDREWFAAQDIPSVQSWLAGLKDSGLFREAMIKRPLWQSEQETA